MRKLIGICGVVGMMAAVVLGGRATAVAVGAGEGGKEGSAGIVREFTSWAGVAASPGIGSVCGGCDVDGDGFEDVLIGEPWDDTNGIDAGAVTVIFNGGGRKLAGAATIYGSKDYEEFGYSVTCAGDLTRDGACEFLVGAPGWTSGKSELGRVYLFKGGRPPAARPLAVLKGRESGGRFGISVLGGVDINSDGFYDIIVSAPYVSSWKGAVYVYLGSQNPDPDPDIIINGKLSYARFGHSMALPGDFNGDGYCDLLIGSAQKRIPGELENTDWLIGRAFIYNGGPGFDSIPDYTFIGHSDKSLFGWSVAGAGDFNGDGFNDIIVGEPWWCSEPEDQSPMPVSASGRLESGDAWVYFGGPAADTTADMHFKGGQPLDSFGFSLAGGFDLNNDGISDLAIGAPEHDETSTANGRFSIFFGSAAPDTIPDYTFYGNDAGAKLGYAVTCGGHLTADPLEDLLVTAVGGPNYHVFGYLQSVSIKILRHDGEVTAGSKVNFTLAINGRVPGGREAGFRAFVSSPIDSLISQGSFTAPKGTAIRNFSIGPIPDNKNYYGKKVTLSFKLYDPPGSNSVIDSTGFSFLITNPDLCKNYYCPIDSRNPLHDLETDTRIKLK